MTTTEDNIAYIVRVTYNDSEGSEGETLHGPFTEAEAQAYAAEIDEAGDTEIEDVEVQVLNLPTKP